MALMDDKTNPALTGDTDIAIVGMAAHLPGADGLDAYWSLLTSGTSAIRRLSDDELLASGEDPARMARRNYVPYAAPLPGFADFEPEFFGFSPKEAAIMDPQHRQFLEVSWEALENAGHMPENFKGPIGVYAGCGMGSYFYFNICSNPDLVEDVGMFLLRHTGNDKDFLATRLSHVLDLKGPSINVQTACSTSLVATHYAAQALLNGECDMAIAGGVTLEIPQNRGYVYKEGEVLSPDGECHAFDHRAEGTVFGSGAGAVVLRRAADAIADGDNIWAIIKGSAVNNDGADKAGYLAPSVGGQAAAIADALALADVPADTIDYVECHGTGTYLGDPIEVAALTEAFRETTEDVGFCRIGSVKTNIGHTDTAAGVASLIKASLALTNRKIPASLGYEKPNPAIEFDTSPFRVNDSLVDWISHKGPRRAGVNSLGVGGTNAYVVLEQPPAPAPSEESDWPFQLLCLSARTNAALDESAARLASHLRSHPEQPLADIAWTLKQGRRAFEKRRVVVAESHDEAAALLEENDPRRVFTHTALSDKPDIAFMFPGGGAQYAGMARDLYEVEPVFAEWMDKGLDILQPKLDYDIRAIWLPDPEDQAALQDADERLKKPSVQLPLIMIVEYALAQLWISWGVMPSVLVGHSMGENTAACLAGVFSFEDAIGLVHLRGELFDTIAPGGMLSVPLSADELRLHLGDNLDIAAENAPGLSVATGPNAALDDLAERLAAEGIETQRIPIDIAAHSRMLTPILDRFRAYLQSIPLASPTIPLISNRSGQRILDTEATDPDYWVAHLRNTILFADCITTLAAAPGRVLIEVGPGRALSSLSQAHPDISPNQVISTLRHPDDPVADDAYFMAALGRLWALGASIDWPQIWGDAKRARVVLPTYPFQRATYYIEPGKARVATTSLPMRQDDLADWGFAPLWRKAYADCAVDIKQALAQSDPVNWLIFQDESGLSAPVIKRLRAAGHSVVTIRTGDAFARDGADGFILPPEMGRAGYDEVIQTLVAEGRPPARIAHFWLVTEDETFRPGSSFFHRNLEQGFFSLLFLAQALADENLTGPLHINVFTTGAAQVANEDLAYPEKATAAGPALVIPREMPGISVASLDLPAPGGRKRKNHDRIGDAVLEELLASPASLTAALRDSVRYERDFGPSRLPSDPLADITKGSTWMITGGFGGIGLTIAAELIHRYQARIVLLGRTALPPRADWPRQTGPIARRIFEIQALEALGGEVLALKADVSNVEEMQAAITATKDRFGPITGVIHAAGAIDDAPLATKSVAAIEEVFTPKIHGTQVLDQLFPDGTLDWLVLFASTSTATAPPGQVDYVAANEYLNAYAKSRAGDKTRVLALNWGIWADVGMASDAVAARDGGRGDGPAQAVAQPLLDHALLDAGSDRVFTTSLSAKDHWVIDEHRLADGAALLPGTGYLELACEALALQGEALPIEIRDLYFLRPLNVDDGGARDVRVRLRRSDEGYQIDIRSAFPQQGRIGFVPNAEARIGLGNLPHPAPVDVAAIWRRCGTPVVAEPGAALKSAQESHLAFGPRWSVLKRYAFGEREGVAELALPATAQGDIADGFHLHPALMDIATGWAMDLIPGYQGAHLWVPVSYEKVRVYNTLPENITSWVSLTEGGADTPYARFDITLADSTGRVLVEIEGFSIRRMDEKVAFDLNAQPAPNELEFPNAASTDTRPLSPAEERLRHNLGQGIPTDLGAEAFLRALAQNHAQIYISSMPLPELIEQVDTDAAQSAGPQVQKFERPNLDQDFVAPEGPIETTLAGFWEELLGVDEIGAEDSFFDLGGHSLIAVRLFARIRKTWNVDFPISILFEAPTIRKIAANLMSEGVGIDPGEAPVDLPSAPKRRFTHLVPMHDGEGGEKTPFFLVAGMFGNVLNLRHLAHLLGADRPFYGLQARGLLGDEEPHRSVPEAAADYIAEIRQVQPHGPYLLGGFSGGGIFAYEITQQLEAAGETVALLVMLDTPLPQRRPLSKRDRAVIQWQELKRKGPGYIGKWAINRVKWELAKRRAPDTSPPDQTGPQFHNAAIEAAFLKAADSYNLHPWSGNLVLYRPPLLGHWQVDRDRWVDSQRAYVTPDNDWGGYASNLTVEEVPGDHDSMVLEPNVRVLAGRMRQAIEAAEATFATDKPIASQEPSGRHAAE
ncbi:MAG TPA: SDR family NAD(P)-dependent oxidoreductase [Aliiroseovarius sp.]|nr:SDR family NAD(P)-dependent oxidoreductase [Aliiroseovarius sp.]